MRRMPMSARPLSMERRLRWASIIRTCIMWMRLRQAIFRKDCLDLERLVSEPMDHHGKAQGVCGDDSASKYGGTGDDGSATHEPRLVSECLNKSSQYKTHV